MERLNVFSFLETGGLVSAYYPRHGIKWTLHSPFFLSLYPLLDLCDKKKKMHCHTRGWLVYLSLSFLLAMVADGRCGNVLWSCGNADWPEHPGFSHVYICSSSGLLLSQPLCISSQWDLICWDQMLLMINFHDSSYSFVIALGYCMANWLGSF